MHKLNADKMQRADIAQIFGVHPSTVSRWKKAGCPVNDDDTTYPAPAVHKWLLDQAKAEAVDRGELEGNSPALERWRECRADIAELDLEIKKGTLISNDDVNREWAARVSEVTSALDHLADRLTPAVIGKEREEISEIIRGEVWRMRDLYARTGKYCEMGDE